MAEISSADVEHTAKLARLELTDEEKQKFTQEIGEILNYVDELNHIRTSEVQTVSQISGLANIARTDEITNKEDRDKMLQNAPEQKDGFISVPKIFDSKTETSLPEAKPKDTNE